MLGWIKKLFGYGQKDQAIDTLILDAQIYAEELLAEYIANGFPNGKHEFISGFIAGQIYVFNLISLGTKRPRELSEVETLTFAEINKTPEMVFYINEIHKRFIRSSNEDDEPSQPFTDEDDISEGNLLTDEMPVVESPQKSTAYDEMVKGVNYDQPLKAEEKEEFGEGIEDSE